MNALNLIKYVIFTVVFIYTFLWTPINLFLSSLGQKKFPITVIDNNQIRQLVKKKTGIDVVTTKISESSRPFGMMIGIPTKPQLILSRNLYDTFAPDEMEYVVLHEAGHYKLWHGAIEFVVGGVLFIIGLLILRGANQFPASILTAVVVGLVFGVIMIRLGRMHEYQADGYSLTHMTNPEGMIQATGKFRGFYGKSYTENNNKVIQFMFYRGNPYDNRIKMAQAEIERRK